MFYAFGQCFQLFLHIALQKTENMLELICKLPLTENRIEKLRLIRFYSFFCLGRLSKNYEFFLGP